MLVCKNVSCSVEFVDKVLLPKYLFLFCLACWQNAPYSVEFVCKMLLLFNLFDKRFVVGPTFVAKNVSCLMENHVGNLFLLC